MFVRKKKNKSGTTSVHLVSKVSGSYRLIKSFGASPNPNTIARLFRKAQDESSSVPPNQQALFSTVLPGDAAVENFLDGIANNNLRTIGPERIFGALFDRIGFCAIPHALFRHLVIARLAYPTSKRKTVDYLYRYQGIRTTEDAVYKFLDSLQKTYKAEAERIAFAYTRKVLHQISVVFYDMTTLYFEAEDEDDLRKIGFSKDGKFQQPQIMVGLLVGEGGFPIGYDVFEGNTFEGYTLLPVLQNIEKKYGLGKPVVVADAGLLSKINTQKLHEQGYGFILGARIKNETAAMQTTILAWAKEHRADGNTTSFLRPDGSRLVVSYADKRARKDAWNRDRGLKKLRTRVTNGRLTKEHITNRGYNKFLKLEGNATVSVDETRVRDDAAWDGLKGYLTNTGATENKIIERYQNLWHIEEAFRISKTDLRIRPIFHFKRRRIEAHLCIAFVAYTIWKELERLLKQSGVAMSPRRAGELTQTMYALEYVQPQSKKSCRRLLAMDAEQKILNDVIHKT